MLKKSQNDGTEDIVLATPTPGSKAACCPNIAY